MELNEIWSKFQWIPVRIPCCILNPVRRTCTSYNTSLWPFLWKHRKCVTVCRFFIAFCVLVYLHPTFPSQLSVETRLGIDLIFKWCDWGFAWVYDFAKISSKIVTYWIVYLFQQLFNSTYWLTVSFPYYLSGRDRNQSCQNISLVSYIDQWLTQ